MTKRIIIDPVTRIEGHAKITIYLDDRDQVTDARFHVTEFRGFERFCQGRPFYEMAGLSARICGICPVSHLLASAKAGDRILAVAVPPAAVKLRRVMNLAQIIQSHALSFFHLSAPDLLLGWESDPAKRNVFGLIASHPDLARGGIRLRQLGQEIIEALGGRKIHPAWAVPGGVRDKLSVEARDRFLARLPEAMAVTRQAIDLFKRFLDTHAEETQIFGNFPSVFMGLVTADGDWEYYDGLLRFMDGAGKVVAECNPIEYEQFIGERVEKDSYLKSPYFKPIGYPDGVYRVGPLARVNICRQMNVALADRELAEFRQRANGVANASFFFHYARLLEILASLEHLERLLPDPELQSDHLRADAGVNRLEGIGVSEAPRGTLFHHYHVNEDGLLQKINLIIATGQNALAMNKTVAQIAKHYIRGAKVEEPILNRVEAGIRAFDPCLSCSTHAVGQMPLSIELRRVDGTLLQEVRRGG
ncbi:MAG TPA: Ni/Fe hydrogenase subunit alpha [Gemmataceae bacterium]|nr:Ni/Fe hydrogenase subunit alpha [Gemmataceae bacterium]